MPRRSKLHELTVRELDVNKPPVALLRRCFEGSANVTKVSDLGFEGTLDWCRFGIRDPSLLMCPDGLPVLDSKGRLTIFFNARNRAITDGGTTCIGLLSGNDELGWATQNAPVFQDGSYAAQGSVLRLAADHFRMYYSPDTRLGFALASAADGATWKRFGTQLILEPNAYGVRRMGLPFVRRVRDQWVMLFEGSDNGRFHIYLALSSDGIEWEPGNRAEPIYLPASDSWDCFGQANPSLTVERDVAGRQSLLILYNGCSEMYGWDIGILTATELEGPWTPLPKPLLRRGPTAQWDAGRVEGARFIERAGGKAKFVYFGLPTVDSYAGGRIAFASTELTAESREMEAKELSLNAEAERSFNDGLALKYFKIWDNYPIQRFTTSVESQLMETVIPQASRVLLLGSGGGRELPVLLNARCRVTAIDISPQMLEIGRQRYPNEAVDWVQADLHHLPPHIVNFDAAVCLGAVFNYLREPTLFLSNVRNAIKPGGTLIMAVINVQHPSEAKAKPSTALPDGRLRQLYDVVSLKELLDSAGFEVVTVRGVRFFVDMLPAELNRGGAQSNFPPKMLEDLLALEATFTDCLPPEQGRFILVHAVSSLCISAE